MTTVSRCGCASSACSCRITVRGGLSIQGSGSTSDPYVISGGGASLRVQDTRSLNLQLAGGGTVDSPWVLSGDTSIEMGDITNLDESGAQAGYVVARKADGSYHLAPAATTAPGAISTSDGLIGDGSAGAPLAARLATNSGLTVDSSGLAVETRTVNNQSELNTKYANVPNGTLVSKVDGTVVWSKIASGWAEVTQPAATRLPVDAIGGPYTSGGWWELPYATAWRKIPRASSSTPPPDISFTAQADGVVMVFGIVNGFIDKSKSMHLRFRCDVANGAGGVPFYGRISATHGATDNMTQSCHLTTIANVRKGDVLNMSIGYYYLSLVGSGVAGNLMKVTDVRMNAVFIPNAVEITPPSDPNDGNPSDGQPI